MAAALPPDTLGDALMESWPTVNLPQVNASSSVPSVHMATVSVQSSSSTGTVHTPSSAKRKSGVLLSANAPRTHLHSTIRHDPFTPLPGRYAMHLRDELILADVKSIPGLANQLSELVDEALALAQVNTAGTPGKPRPQDICIPNHHPVFSRSCRQENVGECLTDPVTSMEEVRKAFEVREHLAAAIASVLIDESSAFPEDGGGLLQYGTTPSTLHGDVEDLPRAGAYLSVHTPSPDLDRRLKEFGLLDAVVIDYQAAAGPLRPRSLFQVMQQMVQYNIPWKWHTCQSGTSSVNICGSDLCKSFPELKTASKSGRPTGVDGDRILEIIDRSTADSVELSGEATPVIPDFVIAMVSFIWQDLWCKAVAVDASCMVLCSGHEEILFLRERRTRTMYMSNTLEIARLSSSDVPPHVKLHCGLALLAWKDVHDRQGKLLNLRRIGRLPRPWRLNYDGDINLSNPSVPFAIKKNAYKLSVGEFLPNQLTDPAFRMDYAFLQRILSKTSTLELLVDDEYSHSRARSESVLFSRSPPLSQNGAARRVRIHAQPRHGEKLAICYLEYGKESGGLIGLPYGCSFILKFSGSEEKLREEQRILDGVAALRSQESPVSVPRTIEGTFVCGIPGTESYQNFIIMEHCEKNPIGIADSIPSSVSTELHTWLSAVHKAGFTHNQLSDHCILWTPGRRSIFVTGWTEGKKRLEGDPALTEEANNDKETLTEILSTLKGNPQKRVKC